MIRITNSLPRIEIEIEYDENVGEFNDEDYEIEFDRYLIRFHISIKTESKAAQQDYLQSRESEEQKKEIYIFINVPVGFLYLLLCNSMH